MTEQTYEVLLKLCNVNSNYITRLLDIVRYIESKETRLDTDVLNFIEHFV